MIRGITRFKKSGLGTPLCEISDQRYGFSPVKQKNRNKEGLFAGNGFIQLVQGGFKLFQITSVEAFEEKVK